MSVNASAHLHQCLSEVDLAIGHIRGTIECLRRLSDDLGCSEASPVSEAFWACIAASEAFCTTAERASFAASQAAREVV